MHLVQVQMSLENVYVYSVFDYITAAYGEYSAIIFNEFSVKNCKLLIFSIQLL